MRRVSWGTVVLLGMAAAAVAAGGDLGQRGPAELVLDVVDVLLDARSGGERLLALQRDQVVLVLAIGEIQAGEPARKQRRGHQDDDECRVLREQAPAGGHSITLSARNSRFCGMVSPIAFAVLRLITSSIFVGCSTGSSPGFAPLRILST